MISPMTKEEAIRWAGTGLELARRLGIRPSAVYMWKDGREIPLLRQYQIKELQALEAVGISPQKGSEEG